MQARLYLIRHTAVNVEAGVCYGRSDVAPAAPVVSHARLLRTFLPASVPIVSSPLTRCRLLAEALGPTHCDARLAELDFGDWELQPYAALPRSALDEWAADPWGFRPPGGETGEEMVARVLACLDETLERHPAGAAIVAHGGPLRIIAGHLRRLARESWLNQAMPLGGCICLQACRPAWVPLALEAAPDAPA